MALSRCHDETFAIGCLTLISQNHVAEMVTDECSATMKSSMVPIGVML